MNVCDHVTVTIFEQENKCAVCLDTVTQHNSAQRSITLQCCKNCIHDSCFHILVLSGHTSCPLCRKDIILKEYYTAKSFEVKSSEIPYIYYSKYNDNYNNIIYQLSDYKYKCCCISMKSFRVTFRYLMRNFSWHNFVMFLLLYFCFFTLSRIQLQPS